MSVSLNPNTPTNAYSAVSTPAPLEQSEAARAASIASRTGGSAPGGSVTDLFKAHFADLAGDKAGFHALLKQSFGEGYDAAAAEGFRKAALAGDFSWLPAVAYVSDEKLGGALGAYDRENNVVYLNRTLASDPGFAASIYVEEAGHFLDTALNTTDTAGDEGELFRRLLAGENISAADRQVIAAENDLATIHINGRDIVVEQWNPFKAIGNAVKAVGKAVSSAAKTVAKSVTTVVKKVGQAVKAGVDFLVDKILTPVVKTLLSTLGPLVEKLGKELAPLIAAGGKVVELLEKVFGPIFKTIGDLAAPILKPLGAILGGVEKVAEAILGPFLKPIREGTKSLISKLTQGARSAPAPKAVAGFSAQPAQQRNANIDTAESQLNISAEELLKAGTITLAILGGVGALAKTFQSLKKRFAPANKKVDFDLPSKKQIDKLHKDRADFAKKQNRKVDTANGRKPIQHQGPRKNLGDGPATKRGATSRRDIDAINAKRQQITARKNAKKRRADRKPQSQDAAQRKAQRHHDQLKKQLKADGVKTPKVKVKTDAAPNGILKPEPATVRLANARAKQARIQMQIDTKKAELDLLNRKDKLTKAQAQDLNRNWNNASRVTDQTKADRINFLYGKGGYGK